jgi:mRNA interferase YafQ
MTLSQTKSFKKDSTKLTISDKHFTKLIEYLALLLKKEKLPQEAHVHELKGNWSGFRECHISGDLLLIYRITDEKIELIRLGSHAQLFE